jgi:hypothetical protein
MKNYPAVMVTPSTYFGLIDVLIGGIMTWLGNIIHSSGNKRRERDGFVPKESFK